MKANNSAMVVLRTAFFLLAITVVHANRFAVSTSLSRPFLIHKSSTTPIKTHFQYRTHRAHADVVETYQMLTQLHRYLKYCTAKRIRALKLMAVDVQVLHETAQVYWNLLDSVRASSRVFTKIPGVGDPFAVVLSSKQTQNSNSTAAVSVARRATLSQTLSRLEHLLVTTMVSQQLEPAQQLVQDLQHDITHTSQTVLQETALITNDVLFHHIDTIPLESDILTTEFHSLEVALRRQRRLLLATPPIWHDATAYMNTLLGYRRTVQKLTRRLRQAIRVLTPIDTFNRDFERYVGGPLQRGGRVWLEWFLGDASNGSSNDAKYRALVLKGLIPVVLKRQLDYAAAHHLDPFVGYTKPLQELLHKHLTSMAPIEAMNKSLQRLLKSSYVQEVNQNQQRVVQVVNPVLTRLFQFYSLVEVLVVTLAAVMVPLEISNALVEVWKPTAISRIVAPLWGKMILCVLSFSMPTRLGWSVWPVLPYGFLFLEILLVADDEAISLGLVLSILLGLLLQQYRRLLLRVLLGMFPGLIPSRVRKDKKS